MCGILGIFGFNDKETVKRAGARIVHRGPDMSGHYVDENIELFHRRLSILDLSKKGRQPMTNEDGSVVIVFNGEIYNFKELREKLKGKYEFRTETDTEVIVHLFEENGIACVEQLEGDFAFVIWDSRKKELFIVRDRVGVKPIYYSKSGSKLVFASEYKSIIPFLDKTEVNKQALSDYLSWGFNPGDETMIKGIYSLPPAHWIRVSKTAIKFQKYWDGSFQMFHLEFIYLGVWILVLL
jgi:asparagine synthase (glutamine-hydrolysing)